MTQNKQSTKIDWLSFSFFTGVHDIEFAEYTSILFDRLEDTSPTLFDYVNRSATDYGNGRRPYGTSVRGGGITIWFSPNIEWSLCEVSGNGCNSLRDLGILNDIVNDVHERCTRIDIATDIFVGAENHADTFIECGYSARFKSHSRIVSSSGTTHYIGSRQSDRLCRVYQYNSPHPRHENLRIEIELKGDKAKSAALALTTSTIQAVANTVTSVYEFASPLLCLSDTTEFADMPVIDGKQKVNNTLLWFSTQVVPAFARLVSDGTIAEPSQWLYDTFICALED